MKIAYEVPINAPMDSVWGSLMDLSQYSEWNALVPVLEGTPGLDATLRAVISPLGQNRRKVAAKVTGFIAPKYFSFEDFHGLGRWFYQEEFIFRMKEREGGVSFFGEIYVTGLSLRFRRGSVEGAFRRALVRIVDSIKERIEGASS
jgi:hypothetical protein